MDNKPGMFKSVRDAVLWVAMYAVLGCALYLIAYAIAKDIGLFDAICELVDYLGG